MSATGRAQLLLLTGPKNGYFISATVFRRLLPKFSRTEEKAVRINPNVIKATERFSEVDEVFEMLERRAVATAT